MSGAEALLAASVLASTAGAYSQTKAANNTASFNAAMMDRDAAAKRSATAEQENRDRRDLGRLQGRQRAIIGASGLQMEGTPLDAFEDSTREAELDILTRRFAGTVTADNMNAQAGLVRSQRRSPLMAAGTQLLMGGSRAFGAARSLR